MIFGVVVAGGRAHVVEVDLQRDRLRADRHEPVLPDEIQQRHLVGDVLEVATEVLFVAAIRRGGDAEHERRLIEMAQRAEVAVRERVMRFVHDDEAEVIARPAVAPSRAHQRLHAGDDDRRIQARALIRHLYLGGEAGDCADFVHGLHDEFLAVGNHERPARLMDGREMREHDGFSTTGLGTRATGADTP